MEFGLKDLLLAGIGGVALGAEKAHSVAGELIRRGEMTVAQGKELTGDLKRRVTDKVHPDDSASMDYLRDSLNRLDDSTREAYANLEERIRDLEKRTVNNPQENEQE